MAELEELLQQVQDGEDGAVDALKTFMAEKDRGAELKTQLLERDLKVQRSAELKGKYPRAMKAYFKGHMKLPDDPGDEALHEALAAKETELEDMGVPLGTEGDSDPAETAPAVSGEGGEAPAGFGNPQGSGSPGGSGPDSSYKLEQSLQSGNRKSVLSAIHEMHRERGPGIDGLRSITRAMEPEAHPNSVIGREH
jgi:hypothetical protein